MLRRSHATAKPDVGTPLDPGHPLAGGVDTYLPFLSPSSAPLDHARGVTLSATGKPAASWGPGPRGGMAPAFAASNYWTLAGGGNIGPGDFTVAFWVELQSVIGSNQNPLSCGTFGSSGWFVQFNASGSNWGSLTVRTTAGGLTASATFAPGLWHHVCWSSVAGTSLIYMDGALIGSGSLGPPTTPTAALTVGAHANGNFGGGFALDDIVLIKGVGLAAPQVGDLYARPWQLFAERPYGRLIGAATPAPTPTPIFRRTLFDRAGSRGVA